jgi:hypothetical protein
VRDWLVMAFHRQPTITSTNNNKNNRSSRARLSAVSA